MVPFISIIIPTYNREHLIGETLDSVLGQTQKLEIQIKLLEENPLNSLTTCKWGRFKNNLNDELIFDKLKSDNAFVGTLELINSLNFFYFHYKPI